MTVIPTKEGKQLRKYYDTEYPDHDLMIEAMEGYYMTPVTDPLWDHYKKVLWDEHKKYQAWYRKMEYYLPE